MTHLTSNQRTVIEEGKVKSNLKAPPTTERPPPPRSQTAPPASNQQVAGRDPNAQGPTPIDLLQRENERLRAVLFDPVTMSTVDSCTCGLNAALSGDGSAGETKKHPTNGDLQRGAEVLWNKQFEGTPWHGKVKLIRPDSMEEYRALALEVWRAVEVESSPETSPKCAGNECLTADTVSGHLPECPVEKLYNERKATQAHADTTRDERSPLS